VISSVALTIWAIASTVPGVRTHVPVPRDAVAAVFLAPAETPSTQTSGASGIELAAFLLQQARESGLTVGLGAGVNALADVVGSLPLLGRYPVACVLLEVRAKELPGGGVRLAALRGGLALHTRGQCEPVARRVQELLNLYTNKEHSRIESSSVDSVTSFALTDDRLPEWAVIEWGEVGETFIIAIGPGSFSGIRVGLATVKGLAVALNKSVVGISSLEILAWATLEVGETGVSVIDARRGEIYVALYRRDRDKLVELGFPMLTGLDQFDAYVAQTCVDVILCGESLPEALLEPRPSLTLGQPSMTPVAACAHLARRRLIKGDADNLHSLVPLYIRRSDAEEKKGR